MLARISPARHISDQLVNAGGGIYQMAFDLPIARVERNGVALTPTTSDPPGSNDEYYHPNPDSTLKIKLASAPSATTNVIVVFYYLFYTSGPGIILPETPTDDSTQARQWHPRLDAGLAIRQSIKNAISGVFTIESSRLSIIDTDNDFKTNYLTSEDSLYQCDVAIWFSLNAILQKVFTGKISALGIERDAISFDVYDSFFALNQPAYMGDTIQEAYFRKESGSFPDMLQAQNNRPCPFIFGNSRYGIFEPVIFRHADSVFGQNFWLDPDNSHPATCTDSSVTGSGGDVNREWGLCRVGSGGFKALDFGTWSTAKVKDTLGGDAFFFSHGPFNYDATFDLSTTKGLLRITWASADHNLAIGDSFSFSGASFDGGNTHYAIVAFISTDSKTVDCMVSSYGVGIAADVSVTTLNSNSAPAIAIYDQQVQYTYFPVYGRDFTTSIATTSGGNKYLKITFADNFEHAVTSAGGTSDCHPGLSILDPSKHVVTFRAMQASSGNQRSHGNALKAIVQASGLSVDSSTFTAADSALPVNVIFQIPNFDEDDYQPYLKYAQDAVESSLGFLIANSDGEAAYYLVANIVSPPTNRDSNLIIDTMQSSIEYADIVTQVIATNPHDLRAGTGSIASDENARAKYLYGISNPFVLRHVIDDITTRLDAHLAIRAKPAIHYSLKTATYDADSNINDDFTIRTVDVLGGTENQDVKIISIEKGVDTIAVEAIVIDSI